MKNLPDKTLIQLYSEKQDNKYIAEIYNRYYGVTYRQCLSFLKDSELAADAVQEIFIKVQTNVTKYRGRSEFKTWLFAISHNFCADQLRLHKQRNVLFVHEELETLSIPVNSDDTLLNEQKSARFKYAFHQLSYDDQQLLKLKYKYRLSLKEIVVVSGISDSAVKMRLLRCRTKFRKAYLKSHQVELAMVDDPFQ